MNNFHSLLILVVCAIVTALIRFLPFIIFKSGKTPAVISYLGKVLPYAIICMLVVFCLKTEHGIPEAIACLAVVLLQVWKRNSLLSIALGTAIYMILVQFVFIT